VGAEAADEVLQESLARAHKLLEDATPEQLLTVLGDADATLKKRLGGIAKVAGPDLRFSDAQAMAYAKQVDLTTRYVKKRLLGMTHAKAKSAIHNAVRSTSKEIGQLETAFSGVAKPLRIRESAVMGGVTTKVQQSLLEQQATSVDRYGEHMVQDFRTLMRKGLMTGVSNSQMVDALVGHGGPKGPKVSTRARKDPVTGKVIRLKEENIPEGLFTRKRYWAERVVRTEVAHGQNEARLRTIERAQQEDFPDMGKKILAMMDGRTAMDSIGVHGQVRKPEELFQDGAGRQYLRPPARPNDRETIVPWRLSWDETPYSAPMPPAEVARLQQADEAPGKAKQVAVRQAQGAYVAQLDRSARKALRQVHQQVGRRVGARVVEARHAQRLVEEKEARGVARARARAARDRARASLERAEAAAASRAQRFVTAKAAAQAAALKRVQDARAQAVAYEKRRRADAKVPRS
jgi:hypothetical protein